MSTKVVNKEKKFFLIVKNLLDKSADLTILKFLGKLFLSESMSHENPQLPYRCRQLKTAGKIHFGKVSHIVDIENLLEIDNFDEFVNNTFLT